MEYTKLSGYANSTLLQEADFEVFYSNRNKTMFLQYKMFSTFVYSTRNNPYVS